MFKLRVLIISDIHMFDGQPSIESPSWISSRPLFDKASLNPLTALKKLFNSSDNIDWIICPGDLADKHNQTCQNVAWMKLKSLRDELHIRHLFGTVGNHDVDSRHVDERSTLPSSSIKSLNPSFPHGNASNTVVHNDYWANGVTQYVETEKDVSLVILNSSQFHGIDSGKIENGKLVDQEWERGSIPIETINRLGEIINETRTNRNILLLHHHLHASPNLPTDKSVLTNSNDVISLLANSSVDWLTVHGHLHVPRLYKFSAAKLLHIFSAGSVGGKTWTGNDAITPNNQVHLIEFSDEPKLKAQIRSWNWTNSEGWVPASDAKHGLPARTGFGSEMTAATLATSIKGYVEQKTECDWAEIELQFPDLNFLSPNETEDFYNTAEQNGLEFLFIRHEEFPTKVKVKHRG